MTITRKIFVSALVSAIFAGVVGCVAVLSLDALLGSYRQRAEQRMMLLHLGEALDVLQDAETAQRGYLITGDAAYLEPSKNAASRLKDAFTAIRESTPDFEVSPSIDAFDSVATAKLTIIEESLRIAETQGLEAARAFVGVGRGRILMDEARAKASELVAIHRQVAELANAQAERLSAQIRTGLLVAVPIAMIVFLLAAYLIGTNLAQPVRAMAKAAVQITHGELETPFPKIQSRKDEIGELATALELMRLALIEDHGLLLARNVTLSALNNRLEEVTRAKSEFLAMMSHEVRTPLNGILGYSDLLAGTELNTAQSEHLETIRNSGKSLLRILNDILDFSKIEAGKLDIESEAFDPGRVVLEICKLFAPRAAENGTSISWNLPHALPPAVCGDATRLRQVLSNLVSNSIKFTRAGTITVSASSSDDGKTLTFSVADNGIGIPEEKLPSLFQSFDQLDVSTARKYGGTGLGLAICRRLCELMGGSIHINPDVKVGSEFVFTISVGEASTADLAKINAVAPAATDVKDFDFSPLRFLIAEDNPVNASLLRHHLRRYGIEVAVVTDGQAATAAAADLIFMDVQMPVMNGIEATTIIRSKENTGTPRTYIIAVTAETMPEEMASCREAGMDDFLQKPFRPSDLESALAKFCAYQRTAAPQS